MASPATAMPEARTQELVQVQVWLKVWKLRSRQMDPTRPEVHPVGTEVLDGSPSDLRPGSSAPRLQPMDKHRRRWICHEGLPGSRSCYSHFGTHCCAQASTSGACSSCHTIQTEGLGTVLAHTSHRPGVRGNTGFTPLRTDQPRGTSSMTTLCCTLGPTAPPGPVHTSLRRETGVRPPCAGRSHGHTPLQGHVPTRASLIKPLLTTSMCFHLTSDHTRLQAPTPTDEGPMDR